MVQERNCKNCMSTRVPGKEEASLVRSTSRTVARGAAARATPVRAPNRAMLGLYR